MEFRKDLVGDGFLDGFVRQLESKGELLSREAAQEEHLDALVSARDFWMPEVHTNVGFILHL